jgi:hypothetical protein
MIIELIENLIRSALNRPGKPACPVRYVGAEESESDFRLRFSGKGAKMNEDDEAQGRRRAGPKHRPDHFERTGATYTKPIFRVLDIFKR